MAQPQTVATVTGEDDDVQAYFLEENIDLFKAVLTEKERKEKTEGSKNLPPKIETYSSDSVYHWFTPQPTRR